MIHVFIQQVGGFCLSSIPIFQVVTESLGPLPAYSIATIIFVIAMQTQALYMFSRMVFYAMAQRIEMVTSLLSQQHRISKTTAVTPSNIEMIVDFNKY